MLRDWANKDEVGTRFPPSRHACPQCGGVTLADNWPPNYGGGSGGGGIWKSWGGQKCICLACRIHFEHSYYDKTGQPREEHIHNITPLVERDGYLLTPHDVWREEEKIKTGSYPQEAYG